VGGLRFCVLGDLKLGAMRVHPFDYISDLVGKSYIYFSKNVKTQSGFCACDRRNNIFFFASRRRYRFATCKINI
jgi:hypothetical protein